ncbi:hypothetical protein H257_05570 [Aphanomyces astaci]|uniref:Uncharacterized protein n=1 Tax=Aphanomyces astaci TaxID=112090 RepID=W4GRW0_APHAT|nr:hypothetical protein H257_05570 [Aphanomyces astaci]ETV82051.1 hypothetical protein H257_05570 [Aphanomyces astaci]|eukprot:XP_009828788.1 hypothetical protein H257_05570 [Aphanomyces astaci]
MRSIIAFSSNAMAFLTGLVVCYLALAVTAAEFRFTNECAVVVQVWTEGNYVACRLEPGESKDDNCGAGPFPVQGSFRVSGEVLRLEYTQHMPGDSWQQIWFDFHAGTGTPTLVEPLVSKDQRSNCLPLNSADPTYPTRDCPLNEVLMVTYCPSTTRSNKTKTSALENKTGRASLNATNSSNATAVATPLPPTSPWLVLGIAVGTVALSVVIVFVCEVYRYRPSTIPQPRDPSTKPTTQQGEDGIRSSWL